jgi:thymidylate kinase
MHINSSFVIKFFKMLNKNYKYAVLRGYAELPENFKSHDIDILIEKNDFIKLKSELKSLFESLGFKLLMVNENGRFNTFIIAKRVNNQVEFLYIDFFFNYSLYGVNLLDAADVLNRRIFNGKVYHVSIVDEFLEKFLNTSLLNHSYPDKYHYILQDINENHNKSVKAILVRIFNDKNIDIEECRELPGRKLLTKAFFSNLLNEPVKQIKMNLQFIYFYIKGWMKPNGFSFSMTGPDGSGKTTILTQLEDVYSKIYREVELGHFRPTVIPRIAELFKKVGLKREVDENYDKPHRGGKTSRVGSWFRLLYYILDYIIGYYKVVKSVLFRRSIVIFDRYYTDIISDSKRSRIYLDYKIIFMLRKLVPKMSYNFIIFVNPDLILQRKKELTREQIVEIYVKLNYICEHDKNYVRINNDMESKLAVNIILDYILNQQDKKYQKFFK